MNESNQVSSVLPHGFARLARSLALTAALASAFAATVATVPARAAVTAAPKMSAADQQEIQQFTLNDDFLHRYEAAAGDLHHVEKPASTSSDPEDTKAALASLSSLDAMTANIQRSPQGVAILQQHGLKPREVVVGGLALMRAEMADTMLANPQMARYVDQSKVPSAANMAFYRAHKAEIQKLMGAGAN